MKKLVTNNFILKVLSVFLAILSWIVVLNINDPVKTRMVVGITVQILNDNIITENQQVYRINEGQIISVKVTGPRTIVDSLRASDFNASVDFMDISKANSVPIQVELKNYEYQSKVTINEQSNNTMRLQVENVVETAYDINIQCEGTVASGYRVASTTSQSKQVVIRAAESVHQSIKDVYALVNVDGVADDFEVEAPLKIMDNSGVELLKANENKYSDFSKIETSLTSVNVSGIVYWTKKIPIEYAIPEFHENVEITRHSLDLQEVQIMGRKEQLNEISSIVLPTRQIQLEEEKKELKTEFMLAELLPEGVYLSPNAKESVTLTIEMERVVQRSKSISVGITNIPDGFDASIVGTGNVNITLEGAENILDKFDWDNLTGIVSLKNMKEGIANVEVQIALPDTLRLVNSVYVQVKLTNKETTTPETTTPQDVPVNVGTSETTTSQNEHTTSENPTNEQTEQTTTEEHTEEQTTPVQSVRSEEMIG